jgi:mannosyltransferase OCH1-like enzyme
MIPPLLHQTAKTADIPDRWRRFQKTVQDLHPGWTYRLWTDDENLAFVTVEYPEFLGAYLQLPRNIMRADVIRYLIMYRLGGLYLDLDYEMLKPFDLVNEEIVLPLEKEGDIDSPNNTICQAFFAAARGHPFFKMLIDELKAHPPVGEDADVESSTGPRFVTKMYRRAREQGMTFCTPDRSLFNPETPHTDREYRAIVDAGVAYGIHHCDGSWREWTLGQRLRNAVARTVKRLV